MGVDIYLQDADGSLVTVPPFAEGGIREARVTDDGTLEPIPSVVATLSITYNYSTVLKEIVPGWDGMCALFTGRRAGDMIPDLESIVERCGTVRSADSWEPTPGNVGAIMQTILEWCRLHPDAVFDTWC